MSFPAALSGQSMAAMTIMSPVDGILQIFNNNPYFIGIMMLILNMGGRFISLEVTKKQEQFLQHPWVRRLLIFTVLFIATRNLWVAFWATVVSVLFLGYLFNENSSLCLFGDGGMSGSSCGDAPGPGEEMTPEEKEILHRLHAKAQRYQTAAEGKKGKKTPEQAALDSEDDKEVSHVDVYAANLSLLRR
jgi:hypothetical protein